MIDQHENFQNAILKKKARIEEINLILAQPRPSGHPTGSRRRLIEERLHLEQAVAELEREDNRLQWQTAARIPFRWEDIDQRLLSPKLQDLADEMQRRAAAAEREAEFETRQSGNSAGYFPRLFEAQRQLADEWAKRLYDVHCEVWHLQGHVVSAAFIRAVSNKAIPELIVARKGAVESGALLRYDRTGRHGDAVPLGEWTRMMQNLRVQWAGRLEAEAVASEYRSLGRQQPRASPNAVRPSPEIAQRIVEPATEGAGIWRSFRSDFKALADEELTLDPGNRRDRWLRAYVDYKRPESDCGNWHISSGPTEDFRARFETLGTRAGVAIGPPRDVNPLDFWLHSLFLDLLKRDSHQLSAARKDEGGFIVRVCEASATQCARLERQAVEKSARESGPRWRKPDADVSPHAKLAEPAKFPTMTVKEVMAVVHISRASVYRYLDEGRLDRPGLNKKPGKRSKALILTTSVLSMLRPAEE